MTQFHLIWRFFGELQDPWKSITVCFNTRAAPAYFLNFFIDILYGAHYSSLLLHLSSSHWQLLLPLGKPRARVWMQRGKKKKSLYTGHVEQQTAEGRTWQGGCDDSLAERMWRFPCCWALELLPGHPQPRTRIGHGLDQFPHKDLAHRQNNLFPHKFCRFCWLKAGLHCYFNIVFL